MQKSHPCIREMAIDSKTNTNDKHRNIEVNEWKYILLSCSRAPAKSGGAVHSSAMSHPRIPEEVQVLFLY